MSAPHLHVFPDPESASQAAAAALVDTARRAIAARGRFAVALAGGNSPRLLYRYLATAGAGAVPWASTHVFWGDERFVPWDHPDSNYRLAQTTFLNAVPIPAGNIHPVDTTVNPADTDGAAGAAARRYADTLRAVLGERLPRLDFILLGLGPDGHLCSLFPGRPSLREHRELVVAETSSPKPPPIRITFTLPLINAARHVHFLAFGSGKAPALKEALAGPRNTLQHPAQAVAPHNGDVTWWVDAAAAGQLDEPTIGRL